MLCCKRVPYVMSASIVMDQDPFWQTTIAVFANEFDEMKTGVEDSTKAEKSYNKENYEEEEEEEDRSISGKFRGI